MQHLQLFEALLLIAVAVAMSYGAWHNYRAARHLANAIMTMQSMTNGRGQTQASPKQVVTTELNGATPYPVAKTPHVGARV